MNPPRPPLRPPLRIAAHTLSILGLVFVLAACQSAPRAGSETRAQVLDVITDRHALRDGHPELFAALRAGVTRQDLADARLVQGECGVADATQPGGLRWHTVTTLLPSGLKLAPGSVVVVSDLRSAWPTAPGTLAPRLHGRHVRHGPPPADARAPLHCVAANLPAGHWQVKVRAPLPAWSFDFAQAALQRLAPLSDADFAAGRVVRLGCQLKVLDGGDWYVPVWITRTPPELALRRGDVVRLRAGAEAQSKDVEPLAQVLERVEAPANAPANAPGQRVVNCH